MARTYKSNFKPEQTSKLIFQNEKCNQSKVPFYRNVLKCNGWEYLTSQNCNNCKFLK